MSLAGPRPGRAALDADRLLLAGLAGGATLLLVVFVVLPLWGILGYSLVTPDGLGLGNYARYFGDPRFVGIIGNTFTVALSVTAATILLAYGFAYALQRTTMRLKPLLRLVALLPIFSPSLVQALGLQFLLGRNGLINRSFGTEIDVYGFWGIFLADLLYAFPHAFLILSTALAVGAQRLYESAETLGASSWRSFRTVTLPATRYGIASAVFVVFTIVITDFGNPVVIGGNYGVLAVEIYNQVSGQANFSMGAVIGVLLLLPAALAVLAERWIARHQHASVSAQSVPLKPRPNRRRDALWLAYCLLVAAALLAVVAIVVYASFVRLWPYNLSLSLRHYAFDVQNGIAPLWTSVEVALVTAAIAVVVVTLAAYANHQLSGGLKRPLYFLAILPAAVPGMVLGLGYILAFNDPANPVYAIYDTILIIAACNIYHYHAQGFLLATTNMKQISRTFEEASATLGASRLTTLLRVTLPMIWPTVLGVGVFFFMRAMVTLSAVIFLITPSTQLAAVSVLYLDDRGALNQAAAFAVCIMATVIGVLLLTQGALRLAGIRGVSLIR
ncbi:iron(III) transport system permease protein [Tistlia consotensis]|uniref:Iron(III) transport system permease protein n=1 Tax=Tistlia consotensis USBA 355 TaxID=560819 RepID=A0A1Y6C2Z7_9PROT|nr:ABC transporter permease subunit [Tistlia consotensis]SMF41124.1 iron(III) transport system permease protein [Tistlia consotensis USBA 355]SNR74033.1 iron(III) transport system permease protein [Tistlia consotensis]